MQDTLKPCAIPRGVCNITRLSHRQQFSSCSQPFYEHECRRQGRPDAGLRRAGVPSGSSSEAKYFNPVDKHSYTILMLSDSRQMVSLDMVQCFHARCLQLFGTRNLGSHEQSRWRRFSISLVGQRSECIDIRMHGHHLRVLQHLCQVPRRKVDAGIGRRRLLSICCRTILQQPLRQRLVRFTRRNFVWPGCWYILVSGGCYCPCLS